MRGAHGVPGPTGALANRPIMGRRRPGGWPSALCAAAGARVCFVWAGLAWRELAQLGWAALDWIGLDWIGWTGGMHARVRVYWRERERKEQGMRDPGVGSGQVRSSAGQQAISSKQAGWLAGWRRAGRFAGRFSGRRRRRVSISMHFNWIDYPLTGGFCHRNLGGTQGRQTTYLPLPPTTYGPLPSLPAPAHRRRRRRPAFRPPSPLLQCALGCCWRRQRACGWAVDGQLTHTHTSSQRDGGRAERRVGRAPR